MSILLIRKYGFQYLFNKLKFLRLINFVHIYFMFFADSVVYFNPKYVSGRAANVCACANVCGSAERVWRFAKCCSS